MTLWVSAMWTKYEQVKKKNKAHKKTGEWARNEIKYQQQQKKN